MNSRRKEFFYAQNPVGQVREFKKASFLTPVFMILEVLVETMIPLVMAAIIDKGVEAGNIGHIYRMGAIMTASCPVRPVGRCHGRKIRSTGINRLCQKPP